MLDFIKKLFSLRKQSIDLIVLDSSNPQENNTYKIFPGWLFGGSILAYVVGILLVALAFIYTPLGLLLYNSGEIEIRNKLLGLSERIVALQDSIDARDRQFTEVQRLLRRNVDTTLSVNQELLPSRSGGVVEFEPKTDSPFAYEMISPEEILRAPLKGNENTFPASFPVEGILTQKYNPEAGHFGIDIATSKDAVFLSIAEGAVIESGWSMYNGFTLVVQHPDGFITVYKHAAELYKKIGDRILKGDALGKAGNTGLKSTGPHLHFEIWKEGNPQNPLFFLIN